MTFTHRTEPVPGADAKASIGRMDETWCESTGALEAETADMLRRDLYEAIGMVRGLILALEVKAREVADVKDAP